VTRAEAAVVQELLDAGEALHRADGDAGSRGEWRRRWERHQRALAEARKLVPPRSSTPTPPPGVAP
jgi:hypothetical protein